MPDIYLPMSREHELALRNQEREDKLRGRYRLGADLEEPPAAAPAPEAAPKPAAPANAPAEQPSGKEGDETRRGRVVDFQLQAALNILKWQLLHPDGAARGGPWRRRRSSGVPVPRGPCEACERGRTTRPVCRAVLIRLAEVADLRNAALILRPDMLLLGIETSCDETAAAVVKDGRQVLSSIVASQDKLHLPYGGVVPEIACRAHLTAVLPVIHRALEEAKVRVEDLDGVAVDPHARTGRRAPRRRDGGQDARLAPRPADHRRQPPARPRLRRRAGARGAALPVRQPRRLRRAHQPLPQPLADRARDARRHARRRGRRGLRQGGEHPGPRLSRRPEH